jgi:hypothetical protein
MEPEPSDAVIVLFGLVILGSVSTTLGMLAYWSLQ